jgi:hypothetical protein
VGDGTDEVVKVWQKVDAEAVRPASWRKQLSDAQAEGQVERVVVDVTVEAMAVLVRRRRPIKVAKRGWMCIMTVWKSGRPVVRVLCVSRIMHKEDAELRCHITWGREDACLYIALHTMKVSGNELTCSGCSTASCKHCTIASHRQRLAFSSRHHLLTTSKAHGLVLHSRLLGS